MSFKKYVIPHRGLLLWGIGLGLLGAIATLAQPLFIGELIRAVSENTDIVGPILVVALFFGADALLSALYAYLIGRAGEAIVFDLRVTLVGRLLRSKLAAFHRRDLGDMFTRTVGDTSIASMVIAQSIADLVTSGFVVIGGIIVMAIIDWQLLVVTLICLGVASALSLFLARQVRIASLQNREDTSALGSGLQRVLGGLTTVKASRAEGRETESMAELAEVARTSGIKVTAISALLQPAMNVGTQLSLAAVIAWGMARVATGSLEPASLTAFVMYLFYLVSPLVMLFMSFGQIQQGRASIQRVEELAEIPQEEEHETAAHLGEGTRGSTVNERADEGVSDSDTGAPAIEFDGVDFSYQEGMPVLHDICLSVPERGLTAIVGPSGAGKSTLFQLIERFYQVDSGSVSVAGRDIAEVRLADLRSTVGYVEQDTPLLRGTIRENLVYARPDASDEHIAEALTSADLDEFIRELPDGLDTVLGEKGLGLSGGQKQRLAIARTLLQEPKVVLLDEVTAHLDSDSEHALHKAIHAAAQNRAVLTIAHRFSTVLRADRIIVMEHGSIRAIGTHRELMDVDEVYTRLADFQLHTDSQPKEKVT